MCSANRDGSRTYPSARAETQRCFEMRDRRIRLSSPQPVDAAYIPAPREARIEYQRPVNKRYHGPDVLAEIRECLSGIRENVGVIVSHFQRAPEVADDN